MQGKRTGGSMEARREKGEREREGAGRQGERMGWGGREREWDGEAGRENGMGRPGETTGKVVRQ